MHPRKFWVLTNDPDENDDMADESESGGESSSPDSETVGSDFD